MVLYLDTETRSGANLQKVGVDNYSRDLYFKVLLISYAINDGGVQVCRPPNIPKDLREALDSDCRVVIHNSLFDVTVLKAAGIADISYTRVCDTMVQALTHGCPASLDMLSIMYNLQDYAKKPGNALISLFCKPLSLVQKKKLNSSNTVNQSGFDWGNNKSTNQIKNEVLFCEPEERPAEWEKFIEYAKFDVVAMRELHKCLPKINYPDGLEYLHWLINVEINRRGLGVDVELADKIARATDRICEKLNNECISICGLRTTQNQKLLGYLNDKYKLTLTNLRNATLNEVLKNETLDSTARRIIELRQTAGSSTIRKYKTIKSSATKEGRLYNVLQFTGASRTGRDSGRAFQPQNLKRPQMFNSCKNDVEEDSLILSTINKVKNIVDSSTEHTMDSENFLDFEVLADLIRSTIIPSKGKKIVVADLSNIEGRVLPWLAGESWKIDNFKAFDKGELKYDNYQIAYSRAMQVELSEVTKEMRSIGKVMELALGYGGGVRPFKQFADLYGLNLVELADKVESMIDINFDSMIYQDLTYYAFAEDILTEHMYKACNYLKTKWRLAHPKIKQFWKDLQDTYVYCIENNKTIFDVGEYIKMRRFNDWLYIKLPSGRYLTYYKPSIDDSHNISYLDKHTSRKEILDVKTYGGKLASNVTSGLARDILYQSLPKIRDAGFDIILLVHDEIVAEVDIERKNSVQDLVKLMTEQQIWCKDLPLAAAGFESMRYKGK